MLRGRQKFDKQGCAYFVTTTLFNFERIFLISEDYSLIVINSLKFLIKEHHASLYAYVIMPSHVSVVLFTGWRKCYRLYEGFQKVYINKDTQTA